MGPFLLRLAFPLFSPEKRALRFVQPFSGPRRGPTYFDFFFSMSFGLDFGVLVYCGGPCSVAVGGPLPP